MEPIVKTGLIRQSLTRASMPRSFIILRDRRIISCRRLCGRGSALKSSKDGLEGTYFHVSLAAGM